ncbi:MAG: hypothetical protein C4523_12480 [Myxococcales bacterium]|nr:MAG: hypothetical protein C4523_12480 [Myxococcales bacterium]
MSDTVKGKNLQEAVEALQAENERLKSLIKATLGEQGEALGSAAAAVAPKAGTTLFTVLADETTSEAAADRTLTLGSAPAPEEKAEPLALSEAAKVALALGLTVGEELGRGGMGRVLLADDLGVGRQVALKVLTGGLSASEEGVRKLVHEAQITGQLEHPNIVPIYQMGRMEDGQLYFTMKRVQGRTLKDVIQKLARDDPETTREFTPLRLLTLFMQVCLAVEFAHSRGVIHRDLKPDNIMLGRYGEALVVDWGLAMLVPGMAEPACELKLRYETPRIDGYVLGTPAYMPPEQAQGYIRQLDRRADVYALGSVLYELLTLTPPVQARGVADALRAAIAGDFEPPSARAPERAIAPELDDICLRALATRKEERYPSARALHGDVEAYFEGTLASERRRREAAERLTEGERLKGGYDETRRRRDRAAAELSALRATLTGAANLETRRALWTLEDGVDAAERDVAHAFSQALNRLLMAETLEPQNREARRALGELYWDRYLDAEAKRDQPAMITWTDLLARVNDGAFDARLRGEGTLAIQTDPPGASAALYVYRERNRLLVPEFVRELGPTPIADLVLPRGGYRLLIRNKGYADLFAPVSVERMKESRVAVRLVTSEALGEGFCYIASGAAPIGGETDTLGSLDAAIADPPAFALARFPVTVGEYLEFLNDRGWHDAEKAKIHASRVYGTGEIYLRLLPDDSFAIPLKDAEGDEWLMDWPILGVSHEDALAYIAWRSARDGARYRLPTDEEWEKAARGADRRRYPWGDNFDPSFCNMRDTHAGRPRLLPVGVCAADESPYGVRDMAGNMRDWTQSRADRVTGNLSIRGGAWTTFETFCRAACRAGATPAMTAVNIGFRLAKDL